MDYLSICFLSIFCLRGWADIYTSVRDHSCHLSFTVPEMSAILIRHYGSMNGVFAAQLKRREPFERIND
jgi:hypothetical protein